jgi:hypothetical protein
MMRVRTVAVIVALLLPVGLSAQIPLPMPGRRPHPAAPQPMPPESGPIARELSYTRLRISVESYPLLSFVQSSGFASGGASTWAALGAGTRAEYRLSRFMSATLDLTSSFLGGPVDLNTAELGARFGRKRTERRLEPFADLRAGYAAASSRELGSYMNDPVGYPIPHGAYGSRYSSGWGGVAGVGAEYGLTRTLSLTTELLATHSRMSAHDVLSPTAQPDYRITSVRYVLGIRYNPVRMIVH